jgi:SSS family transporter
VSARAVFGLLLPLALRAASFHVEASGTPPPPLRPGSFAGDVAGVPVVGGGLDEQGRPTSGLYILQARVWKRFALPQPVAWAAAVSGPKLTIIGGVGPGGPASSVYTIGIREGAPVFAGLPALPQPLAMAGAAAFHDQAEEQIYVTGPSAVLYRFAGGVWQSLPPLPGGPRLTPAVICFYNDVLVFGGLDPATRRPLAAAEAFRWKPVDGTTSSGWRRLPDMPEPAPAPLAFQTGQVHAGVIAGTRAFLFHDVTETWVDGGSLSFAPSAAWADSVGEVLASARQVSRIAPSRTVRALSWIDYSVVAAYFALVAFLGIRFASRQKRSEGFALGDRRIPWWMAGISMFSTGASSISFMAIPAQAFRTSLLWSLPTLALIPLFVLEGWVLYPLVRRLRITSTFEYLERRFHPSLRTLASAQCIALQVFGRMNMVMLLPALALHAVTGANVYLSVLLVGVMTTLYTAKGGIRAVVMTEVIQGIAMLLGISAICWLAISAVPGGFSGFVQTGRQFDRFRLGIWSWDATLPVVWILVLTPIMNKIAVAADQPVIQRVFATPLRDVRKVAGMFLVCSVLISFAVTTAGVAIFTYFHAHPDKLDPTMTNDQVVPLYIVQRLPTGLAGLIVAALFSAAASALAGSMNSVAVLFTEDFYRKLRPDASDAGRLGTMRFASLGAGALATGCALYMASLNQRSLFQTWNEMIALLGGGFLGIYVLGTFTRRANLIGAFTGAAASIGMTIWVRSSTSIHWYAYSPIAVATCIAVGYFVSLAIPTRSRDLTGLTVFDMKSMEPRTVTES